LPGGGGSWHVTCHTTSIGAVLDDAVVRPIGVISLDRRVPFVVSVLLAGDLQVAVDIADFEHSPFTITLGASQSNDVTRILPPSSRLTASVVLSVVPSHSRTFSSIVDSINYY